MPHDTPELSVPQLTPFLVACSLGEGESEKRSRPTRRSEAWQTGGLVVRRERRVLVRVAAASSVPGAHCGRYGKVVSTILCSCRASWSTRTAAASALRNTRAARAHCELLQYLSTPSSSQAHLCSPTAAAPLSAPASPRHSARSSTPLAVAQVGSTHQIEEHHLTKLHISLLLLLAQLLASCSHIPVMASERSRDAALLERA